MIIFRKLKKKDGRFSISQCSLVEMILGFQCASNANWKLAIENYCESYHLPSVHPELNKTSKLSDHYHICESENYSGQGSFLL